MMKRIFLLFSALAINLGMFPSLFAQYESVNFNYQKANFNNGQPLPSESYLSFTGPVTNPVAIVEVAAYREGTIGSKKPLHQANWKRTEGTTSPKFDVQFFYKLRGKSNYDFLVTYFRPVNHEEREKLEIRLHGLMKVYLLQSIELKEGKAKLNDSRETIMSNLNTIFSKGMTYYRGQSLEDFSGFSDIIAGALKNVQKQPVGEGVSLQDHAKTLLNTTFFEVSQLLEGELFVKMDERKVLGYPTEKTRSSLALNLGYGGVFIDGNLDDITYGASPYAGISIPLGNSALRGSAWANTSISLGVFIQNFENKEGDKVTGPIFGRPYYAALGYSFFRFLRLNVGATLLETQGSSTIGGGNVSVNSDAIKIAPFIGLSAEIDIWLGLREKGNR